MRVLLVEDHDLLAGTVVLALRVRGVEAESISGPDATAVLAAAQRLAPVVVLLDLDLGRLGSGLDLVAPLSAGGAQVAMLTGVTDRAQLAACVEAGAVGLLPKTIPFDELLDAVDRLAAGERLLTARERDDLRAELQAHRRSDRDRLAPFEALTAREKAVLARLVAGDSAEVIAEESYVSLATVRSQIRAILVKLDVSSQLAAVAVARRAGWPPSIHQS